MKSIQNHNILRNLYRVKSLGFNYIDPIALNHKNALPSTHTMDELKRSIKAGKITFYKLLFITMQQEKNLILL